MFSLPIPFIEKGALDTYLHSEGYVLDCDCGIVKVALVEGDITLSGATISIDLSTVEAKLDTIIADGVVRNDVLADVLTELQVMTSGTTQTIITTTIAGAIPAGVVNYAIFNLGLLPNDPSSASNAMIINGIPINSKYITFSNSNHSIKRIENSISYDPNGNTLMIDYNL